MDVGFGHDLLADGSRILGSTSENCRTDEQPEGDLIFLLRYFIHLLLVCAGRPLVGLCVKFVTI